MCSSSALLKYFTLERVFFLLLYQGTVCHHLGVGYLGPALLAHGSAVSVAALIFGKAVESVISRRVLIGENDGLVLSMF